MADHPDVYADGLTVTVNPLGLTVSFTRTEPATPGVTEAASVVISCRVRMARKVAEGLRDTLTQALQGKQDSTKTVSH